MLIQLNHPRSNYRLLIDDDGRVTYAYLLRDEQVIGDVWLYDDGPARDEPEWHNRAKAPFANPSEFVSQTSVARIQKPTDVQATWIEQNDSLIRVETRILDQVVAILEPGAKPGWSIYAAKDGPVAKVLRITSAE
jgi:hypothetical protein